ncbi:MAG: hypothetical protein ACK5HR_00850 [Mycoplasmatales bacterium]
MTFEKKFYLTKLYDIYYELFTIKQQEIFELYIDEDYSITEIATKLQVSNASISKTIRIIKEKLEILEQSLHILQNYEANIKLLQSKKIDQEIIKKIK